VLSACGGSGDSGAGELARQQELAAARRQAAEDARQSAHIEELEHRVKRVNRDSQTPSDSVATAPAPISTPSEAAASLGDWPGGSGYTAVLASQSSEAEARSTQREAANRGLDVGVLYSSDFNSLRPGYWAVFPGTFGEEQQAATRARRAQELGYPDAYPRFVVP
jgi:hypothetical protein